MNSDIKCTLLYKCRQIIKLSYTTQTVLNYCEVKRIFSYKALLCSQLCVALLYAAQAGVGVCEERLLLYTHN